MDSPTSASLRIASKRKGVSTDELYQSEVVEPSSSKRPVKRSRSSIGNSIDATQTFTPTNKRTRRLFTSAASTSDVESSDSKSVASSSPSGDDSSSVASSRNLTTPRKSTRATSLAISSAKAIRTTIQDDERISSITTGAKRLPNTHHRSISSGATSRKKATSSEVKPMDESMVLTSPAAHEKSNSQSTTLTVSSEHLKEPSSPKRTRSRQSYGGVNSAENDIICNKPQTTVQIPTDERPVRSESSEIIHVPDISRPNAASATEVPPIPTPPIATPPENQSIGQTNSSPNETINNAFSVMNHRLPKPSFLLLLVLIGATMLRQFFPTHSNYDDLSSSPATYLFAPLHHLNEWKGMHIGKRQYSDKTTNSVTESTTSSTITVVPTLSDEDQSEILSKLANLTNKSMSSLQAEILELQGLKIDLNDFVENFNISQHIDYTQIIPTASIHVIDSESQQMSLETISAGIVEIPVDLNLTWLQEYHENLSSWEEDFRSYKSKLMNTTIDDVEIVVNKVEIKLDDIMPIVTPAQEQVDALDIAINQEDTAFDHLRDALDTRLSDLENKAHSRKLPTLISSLVDNISSASSRLNEQLNVHCESIIDVEVMNGVESALEHFSVESGIDMNIDSLPVQAIPAFDERELDYLSTNRPKRTTQAHAAAERIVAVTTSNDLNDNNKNQEEIAQDLAYSYLENHAEDVDNQIVSSLESIFPPEKLIDNVWGVDFGVAPRGGRVVLPKKLSKIDGSELTSPCFQPGRQAHEHRNTVENQNFLTRIKSSTLSVIQSLNTGNCLVSPNIVNSHIPIRPGRCYPISGKSGSITLSAYAPINLHAITISHYVPIVSEGLPLLQSSKSAIKNFQLVGYSLDPSKYASATPVPLGSFSFNAYADEVDDKLSKVPSDNGFIVTQIFPVDKNFIHSVQIIFESNHGESNFSCVYRVQMLGDLATI